MAATTSPPWSSSGGRSSSFRRLRGRPRPRSSACRPSSPSSSITAVKIASCASALRGRPRARAGALPAPARSSVVVRLALTPPPPARPRPTSPRARAHGRGARTGRRRPRHGHARGDRQRGAHRGAEGGLRHSAQRGAGLAAHLLGHCTRSADRVLGRRLGAAPAIPRPRSPCPHRSGRTGGFRAPPRRAAPHHANGVVHRRPHAGVGQRERAHDRLGGRGPCRAHAQAHEHDETAIRP